MDAVSLGDQPEQCTVAIETPGEADSGDLNAGLAIAIKDLVAKVASGVSVGEGDGHITVPLHIHHRNEGIWENAFHRCSPGQLLQSCHSPRMPLLNRSDLITGIIHHKSKTPEMCKVLAKASCEREAVNSYHRLKQQGSGREDGVLQMAPYSGSSSHLGKALL